MTNSHRAQGAWRNQVALAILAVYMPFALGGAAAEANRAGRITFAVLYTVSALATAWLLVGIRASLPPDRPTRVLGTAAAVLLALAAVAHLAEASIVLAHPALSVASADRHAGGLSGPIQAAGLAGLILGTLLLCITLRRARLAPAGPALLFVLVLPTEGLPHGTAQQLIRSLIVLSVAIWLAWSMRPARPASAGVIANDLELANPA